MAVRVVQVVHGTAMDPLVTARAQVVVERADKAPCKETEAVQIVVQVVVGQAVIPRTPTQRAHYRWVPQCRSSWGQEATVGTLYPPRTTKMAAPAPPVK